MASRFLTVNAENHALNVEASKFRRSIDSMSARLASDLRVEASASFTRDSLLHFAAAYPDQAAMRATIDNRTASAIERMRS